MSEDRDLTDREEAIMKQLVLGLLNKEIAKELGISKNTVERHLANIFGKLGARNRLEAVRQYQARGNS